MDYEVHPVGTAAKLAKFESEPLARQVARLNNAITMNLETIREISESRHADPGEKELKNAARALREFYSLKPETALRYAETALEAAYAARGTA